VWEKEMLEECRTLLVKIMLQVDNDDGWCWILIQLLVIQLVGLIASSRIGPLPLIV